MRFVVQSQCSATVPYKCDNTMICVGRPHLNEQGTVIIIYKGQSSKILLTFSQNIIVLLSHKNVINMSVFNCEVCGICK